MPSQSNQSYGVPLFGMPLKSNAVPPPQTESNATPSAPPPKQSNATPLPVTGESRDRTSTEESVSKETLVKLMKEQVDLVNRLTDQQQAQQMELDRIKEEKRKMEEQAKLKQEEEEVEDNKLVDMVNQLTKDQIAQKEELDRVKEEKRLMEEVKLKQEEDKAQQQKLEQLMSQNNKMAPLLDNSATPAPSTSPPAARPRLGTSDSGKKSIISMFKRPPDNRYTPMNVPEGQQKVRRHPDAIYFNGGSTSAFPTAIVINNDKRNRNGGAQRDPSIPVITGPGAVTGYSKDRIEITHIPERNVVNEKESSCVDSCWWAFSRLCTLLIPSFALFWVGRDVKVTKGMSCEAKDEAIKLQKEAKQAWREKVAIFLIQMTFCCGFFGVSAVIPMYVCRETTTVGKSLIPDM